LGIGDLKILEDRLDGKVLPLKFLHLRKAEDSPLPTC
jgi:hypothetical protein